MQLKPLACPCGAVPGIDHAQIKVNGDLWSMITVHCHKCDRDVEFCVPFHGQSMADMAVKGAKAWNFIHHHEKLN